MSVDRYVRAVAVAMAMLALGTAAVGACSGSDSGGYRASECSDDSDCPGDLICDEETQTCAEPASGPSSTATSGGTGGYGAGSTSVTSASGAGFDGGTTSAGSGGFDGGSTGSVGGGSSSVSVGSGGGCQDLGIICGQDSDCCSGHCDAGGACDTTCSTFLDDCLFNPAGCCPGYACTTYGPYGQYHACQKSSCGGPGAFCTSDEDCCLSTTSGICTQNACY